MAGKMNFMIILALVSVASADLNTRNRRETTAESLEESLSSQEGNFTVSIGSAEDFDDEAALRIAERARSAAEHFPEAMPREKVKIRYL